MATIEQTMMEFNASKSPRLSDITDTMREYEKKKTIVPSIYSKGGIYEQFGENPPIFNPYPGRFGGMIQTGADQPGTALPFLSQAVGGFAGPVGGVAGAMVGEGARQGLGRLFGVQNGTDSLKQFKQVGKNAVMGEVLGYGGGQAIEKATKVFGPVAKNAAIRIAKNIIRPTGKLAKRSDVLAKTALEEGVLSSSPQSMVKKVKAKGSQLQAEIDNLIENYEGGNLNAESALRRMDALARKYRSLGAFEDANKVLKVKNQIIEGGNLRTPVFEEKEVGQFVMGPSSKQVSPKLRKVDTRKMDPSSKNKALKKNREGGFWGMSGERRIVSPKDYVEKPDDIVALHRPGKRMAVVSPEETYQIRPETKGVSYKETVKVGESPREMTAKQMNKRKREEYRYLEGKRQGGGWMSDTSTPEIVGRQEFAGGLRRSIARAIPEVDPLNRRFGNIIDLGKAVEGRASVGTRNDIMSLGDIFLASNPKTLPLAFLRKGWQGARGFGANALYGLPKSGKNTAEVLKNPATRALIASLYQADQN